MDTISIQQLCKTIREGLEKARLSIAILKEKLESGQPDLSSHKSSLENRLKNLSQLLQIVAEENKISKMINTTYTSTRNKKIVPEKDIRELDIPRFNQKIKVGTRIRAFYDDIKPRIEDSNVCTIVGFVRNKKKTNFFGTSKKQDDFDVIVLFEEGDQIGNVITVGLTDKFFNQCDLIRQEDETV